ncbi:MAG: serine/threonine-protein phosphatase [Bacteroidia bacterium]|nr:serine/threonine-protein phosphatase [Bacteroidia bacterium]
MRFPLLNRIIDTGITGDVPFALANKIKVFNTANLIILVVSVIYTALGLIFGYHLAAAVTFYSITSNLLCFYLVSQKKHRSAFHYAVVYGLIFLSAFSILFGLETNSHYYFLFLPIAVSLFFDKEKTVVTYFIICVIALVMNVGYVSMRDPVYFVEGNLALLAYPNLIFIMILIFLAIRVFRSDNQRYASQIEEQKASIEEKNKDITDSITYAKRIQRALLTSESVFDRSLKEYFLFYEPKDIVSGDFYWATTAPDGSFLLLTGDCTGHGVPGAFMSLLNISMVNEIVNVRGITDPSAILNAQREGLIASLNPEGSTEVSRDGMDCSLCRFDFTNKKLTIAGANNPVWIVRDGQLLELKTDKQPVGLHEGVQKDFTTQHIDLRSGDMIYTLTDGFADQFGGDKGKKYKYSRLKELLIQIAGRTVADQKFIVEKEFRAWKREYDQVDDVLVVGIKM